MVLNGIQENNVPLNNSNVQTDIQTDIWNYRVALLLKILTEKYCCKNKEDSVWLSF